MLRAGGFKRILTIALVVFGSSAALAADDGLWSVSKSSGEVWIATPDAVQVSLGREEMLNPGDTIRTGRNGRVLLQRGAETILIAPNSVVGLPNEARDGMATTILQRAGSILLDVEKRNVKHLEVETPYLAAVVKGTQFRVTITAAGTKVEVARGQVEVSDFKTGQIAQVMPGQAATAFATGRAGLSLSGSGSFNPIEHGSPRASAIDRVPVPKDGLHAPRDAMKGNSIHALNTIGAPDRAAAASHDRQRGAAAAVTRTGVVRLSTSLGEVKLNVVKATHGLAHGGGLPGVRTSSGKDTVWSDAKASAGSNGAATGDANASSTTSVNTSAASTTSAVSAAIGAANASNSNNGNGNGNGATGNGKRSGNSNAGGNGNGDNNGNSGNNGNNGNNGNGNGNGNSGNNGKGKKS
jgi:hypothetical protein